MMTYVLHYAPDNASIIIRMALEHRGLPYRTQLVDRATAEQTTQTFRALNPMGLIPVLETPQGVMFETGAILLWLADTHGGLGPAPDAPERGDFLKWLFFAANTLHPALRMTFYTEKYIAADQIPALRLGLRTPLYDSFTRLNEAATSKPAWFGGPDPTVLDFYVCALARWAAIYPSPQDCAWFNIAQYPALHRLCARVETLPCCAALQNLDGLGTEPFTNPSLPNPSIGSAT